MGGWKCLGRLGGPQERPEGPKEPLVASGNRDCHDDSWSAISMEGQGKDHRLRPQVRYPDREKAKPLLR